MLIPQALDQVWRPYATDDLGTAPAPFGPRTGITRPAALELERRHAAAAVQHA